MFQQRPFRQLFLTVVVHLTILRGYATLPLPLIAQSNVTRIQPIGFHLAVLDGAASS